MQRMQNPLTERARFWSARFWSARSWSARSWSLIALLVCAMPPGALAETVPVRHVEGTLHGFLELRSENGRVLASGDSLQVVRGDQVTTRTVFTFKDGSIDDETTVFSQRRTFRLITYHHIQKGPFFPHPIDLSIDARSGQVTVHSTGKDGKEEVQAEHLDLPQDLANGMVSQVIENLKPGTTDITVSILAATPKPRLIKLAILSRSEEPFSVAGSSRKALHYEIKIEIGGIAGVVAPLIGKEPPNIQIWTIGGEAPAFAREQGPIYPDGPVMTIELASPVWPDSSQSGN